MRVKLSFRLVVVYIVIMAIPRGKAGEFLLQPQTRQAHISFDR